MKVVFLDRRQLRVLVIVQIILILTGGFLLNSNRIARRVFGVKNGVRLEGYNVGGMLPEELTAFVSGLAEKVNRMPRNAGYFPETGEIIPAKPGRKVRVAETVHQVCMAKAGSQFNLLVAEISPRISEQYFEPVYHGNETLSKVAITINVAWGEEYLPDILQILKQEKVKATFFFIGTWVKAFPEIVNQIADQGHEIANHGLYHGHPLKMKREELRRLIVDNNQLLKEITGKNPAKLFAPPYGEINAQIASVAGEQGYRTILWSADTIDWKNPTPDVFLNRVLSKIAPGGIILMHPTIATKNALLTLVRSLRKRGLEPVTVSEILK